MVKNSKHNKSAAELIDEIERSRYRVSRNLANMRDELDLPKKIQRSFRRQPAVWMFAAITLGLVLSAISTRKKKVDVDVKKGTKPKNQLLEAGFFLGALKVAATVFKPVIVPFLQQKVREFSGRGRTKDSR
jgi:uncharacterized membrane protein